MIEQAVQRVAILSELLVDFLARCIGTVCYQFVGYFPLLGTLGLHFVLLWVVCRHFGKQIDLLLLFCFFPNS